jgi:hypothetical protein
MKATRTGRRAPRTSAAEARAAIDEIDAVPPADFVRARNALVARLRTSGHGAAAAEVAARRRPNVVAWLVNRLARIEPAGIRRLLDAADRLRRTQLRDGRETSEATAEHRAALQDLLPRLESIRAEAGVKGSPALLRRVQATLASAAADRGMHPALRQGRLVEELSPRGFEVFDGVPAPHLRLVTRPTAAPSTRGRTAVAAEERRAMRAQREAARREAQAQRRREAARAAEEGRRQRTLDRATRQAERLREQLREVEARIARERRQT